MFLAIKALFLQDENGNTVLEQGKTRIMGLCDNAQYLQLSSSVRVAGSQDNGTAPTEDITYALCFRCTRCRLPRVLNAGNTFGGENVVRSPQKCSIDE